MAQPITKWPTFYSKFAQENPGSTKQQASIAWNKYKETHGIVLKTSPKTSPTKTSPSKSPSKPRSAPKTEMHRLVQPTLTGLPPGVGEMISGYLPGQALAALQATSKRTKAITQQELMKMCDEFPTKGEVLTYVKDMLGMPTGEIHFIRLPNVASPRIDDRGAHFSSILMSEDLPKYRSVWVDVHDLNLVDIDGIMNRFSSDVTDRISSLADPTTILEVMLKRKSCHKTKEYYIQVALQYAKNIIRPFLAPLLDSKQIEEVFAGKTSTISTEIPPQGEVETRFSFRLAMYNLHLLLAWLERRNILEGIFVPNIINEATMNLRREFAIRIMMFFRANGFVEKVTKQLPSIYPTATEILEYMQKKLESGESARVAFYIHMPRNVIEFGVASAHTVTEFLIADNKVEMIQHKFASTYYPKIPTSIPTITKTVERNQATFNNMLKTKIVPGLVDTKTLHAIINREGIYTPRYRPQFVDSLLRVLLFNVIGTATRVINWLSDNSTVTFARLIRGEYRNVLQKNIELVPILATYLLLIARWNGHPLPELEKTPITVNAGLFGALDEIMKTFL